MSKRLPNLLSFTHAIVIHAGKRVITAALLTTKFANTAASVLNDNSNAENCSQKPALIVVHDSVYEQWVHVLRTWTQCSVVELCSNEKKLCRHIHKVQEGDYDIAVCSYSTLALRTQKVSRHHCATTLR
jgi:glycine cleavage system pyridoxal-binding protein P